MSDYFSDRELGAQPRLNETIGDPVWRGLFALIQTRINSDAFGYGFPQTCTDGNALCGTDISALWDQARAELPDLVVKDEWIERWPPSPHALPPTIAILDLLEFLARAVADPLRGTWHDYLRHHHLSFDRNAGLRGFVADVNRLLARGGIAFELTPEGKVQRLLSEPLAHILRFAPLRTDDEELNNLLYAARAFITSPNVSVRRDGVEKLWDAFERIKTIEPGSDKKARADALLKHASEKGVSGFFDVLSAEAR
jgi:hypothetical protein